MTTSRVSIIMPCYNEEKFIAGCLESIIANDYPDKHTEILIIDGMSTDRTREIVEVYAKKYHFIKLFDNPKRIQTFATNMGINASTGDFVIRMDAHSAFPSDYISKSVRWLAQNQADCVGGLWITKAGRTTRSAEAIALALSHPFGVGNAYFRIGSKEPKYVDTVPFGCYRREVFDKVGLFNENLNRTDDIEFNLRLKKAGGKILLVPDIVSYYYARPDLPALAKQNFGNGFWVLYSMRFVQMPFSLRHLVPLCFVLSVVGTLFFSLFSPLSLYMFSFIAGLYLLSNAFFSFRLSLKHGFKYFFMLLATFFTLHVSYGFGSLWGLTRLAIFKLLKC